ncbi:MFS transporter [Clostridium sp. AF19-22AC]|jgi:GPH family glycoside/pentoside/hexuronide:cation symporter|uniref:GPH family glycoside/pentoside/hexuronide:cation symporter n=1 Tax=Faecalicatena orotica TaxID=1544 RepID=A0A2Y9B9J1_9FIRM|nr:MULTISPECIES: glycoside-pentoside-hexuronide (GPH):cation symporter [Clostridia]PWJ31322.1 GPH family glycoside/pentoside/hexuronide:cation symporter [Faecalicatena orotica]RHR26642.1 MFS transporter [Clostridium sp. AF19-22AC]SSA54528.1 glycoside/pentoside/hexuronide:cation symporter, GPH family [Faecalicatena orotica]
MENGTEQKLPDGKLSMGIKLSYASGDVACNVVFGMVGTLLTLFYTDYVGINPATVGMVMLLSRLFDGVSDLIMGVIVERTNSKWGKSRPWILWMSVPFALSAVLLFTVPNTTGVLQFVYLFVTYNFCTTVCYTAINLPYGSLSAMMTRVSSERDMLSVVRMGLSPIGKIIAATCTLPIVKLFGDDQAAWIKTMSIWAVLALILLLVCFFRCEETVKIEAKQKAPKVPLGKSFSALFKNQYFWAVLVLWMVQSVSFGISGTILPYYCKYIFGNDTWMYSALFLTETLTLVAGIFACTPLIKKFGKRNIALAGSLIALAGQLIFFFNPYSFAWMVMSCLTRAIGLAPLNAVVFGMVGDVVEFGQWKTHIRQESLVFAGGSIGTKVGAGLASATMTGLLSAAGYISTSAGSAAQPDSALNMIVNIYKFGPVLIALVAFITLALYKLDKAYPSIMKELIERESRGEL